MTAGLVSFGATGAAAYDSLYASTVRPSVEADSDARSVEVGVKFSSSAQISVVGLRFYKAASNSGSHVGTLWSPTGTKLASVTFANESASGWQSATLSTPVVVLAGKTYTASYHASHGHYSETPGAFGAGSKLATKSVTASGGVYGYGASSTYPTQSWQQSSYLVDVMFAGAVAVPQGSTSHSTVPTPVPTPAPATGFPNAASTGSAGALKAVPGQVSSGPGWKWNPSGSVDITGANTTFSGYAVSGSVEIYAPNAKVTNDDIADSGNGWAIGLRPGSANTVISDNSIHGQSAGSGRLGYGIFNVRGNDSNLQVLRNDIYWTSHGVQVERGLIQDNWIHSMGFTTGDHTECIFSGGGDTGQLTIRHNTLTDEKDQVAAIILSGAFGKQVNRTIDNNLLAGGGYTLYGGSNPTLGSANLVVTNNKFSTSVWPKGGYYGSPVIAFAVGQPGNKWSNNTWYEAGTPVAAVP